MNMTAHISEILTGATYKTPRCFKLLVSHYANFFLSKKDMLLRHSYVEDKEPQLTDRDIDHSVVHVYCVLWENPPALAVKPVL